jgi:hypothetical protein
MRRQWRVNARIGLVRTSKGSIAARIAANNCRFIGSAQSLALDAH